MPAMVHSKEIERLSKKDGTKKSEKASDAIHHFEVEPMEDGGHVVTNHYEGGKTTKHHVKSHSAMKKHMDSHCDCGIADESAEVD